MSLSEAKLSDLIHLILSLFSVFTASLQCCCCHQPHEEAAAGPHRAGPEADQCPRHQRVLPQKNPQTSRSRQARAQGGRCQWEHKWDTSHVPASEPYWFEEPLPPTEGLSEPGWCAPCTHHSRAGKACLPLGACQPEWVSITITRCC